MRVLDLKQFDDCVVLHFDTEGKRINAYTLASTLVALADAAKAANKPLPDPIPLKIQFPSSQWPRSAIAR